MVTDQRVHKVCTTLTQMNFEVILIGRKLPQSKKVKRPYKTTRMRLLFKKGFLFYAEYNLRLFFKLFFQKKDILLSNDLDTLLPNYLISRIFQKKLIYDSHELFSELPSINGRFSQKIWRLLENWLIPKQKHFYTVSNSISDWYSKNHGVKPLVIKNLPTKKKITFEEAKNKYIIYQGALNNGRGLLVLLEALQMIDIQLKIVGKGPFISQIKEKIAQLKLEDKVELLGEITPEDLIPITQKASLGVSLEEDLGLSYRYSLPNKLFDYIQAKTPVLATYLPEIKNIVETYNIGEIIEDHSPKTISKTIRKMLKNGKKYYQPQLEKASKELVWKNQENLLKSIF